MLWRINQLGYTSTRFKKYSKYDIPYKYYRYVSASNMHLLASTWVVPARVAVCEWYRVAPIIRLYSLIIGLVNCNPIPNLLNAAKWPFIFLLWPNGHSYSFCGLAAIPFPGYLSTIAFPTKQVTELGRGSCSYT